MLRKDGPIGAKLTEKERVPLEKLLDGIYGVFRNKYNHQDIKPDFAEAHAILWSVNWVLLHLGTVHAQDAAPAAKT